MKTKASLGLAVLATLLVGATLAPTDAQAQRGRRYGTPRRDWVVRPLVDSAERQSNAFRAYFESHDARGRLGRFHDNKYLKNQIQDMDEAFERLRSKADDRRPGVGKPELQDALRHARMIDREVYFAPDTRKTIREWNDLRITLNSLANLYDVRGLR